MMEEEDRKERSVGEELWLNADYLEGLQHLGSWVQDTSCTKAKWHNE